VLTEIHKRLIVGLVLGTLCVAACILLRNWWIVALSAGRSRYWCDAYDDWNDEWARAHITPQRSAIDAGAR
jgi:hypothetical protein